MITHLYLRRPDDWHIHFRDGALMRAVAPESARLFARGIIMPNLVPPVATTADAAAYRSRILATTGTADFEPLMTLYLTDSTDANDVRQGTGSGLVHAVKLYPAGATTNSASGVTDLDKVMPVLETMAALQLPLCVHGEVTQAHVDIFDREAVFIDTVLAPLQQRLPELRVVLEHVTTRHGVEYIQDQSANTAATITPHHLMINRNHLLVGGIRPHYYCLPVVKRQTHQQALREAATSGDHRFFLGTDSAPHLTSAKESACGCAGVFNTPNAMSCLAQVFEEENALERLEHFTSLNGPAFYRLPPNEERIELVREDEPVTYPTTLSTTDGDITLFNPGVPLYWRIK